MPQHAIPFKRVAASEPVSKPGNWRFELLAGPKAQRIGPAVRGRPTVAERRIPHAISQSESSVWTGLQTRPVPDPTEDTSWSDGSGEPSAQKRKYCESARGNSQELNVGRPHEVGIRSRMKRSTRQISVTQRQDYCFGLTFSCGLVAIRYSPVPDESTNSIWISSPAPSICLYHHFSKGYVSVVPPPSSDGRL